MDKILTIVSISLRENENNKRGQKRRTPIDNIRQRTPHKHAKHINLRRQEGTQTAATGQDKYSRTSYANLKELRGEYIDRIVRSRDKSSSDESQESLH